MKNALSDYLGAKNGPVGWNGLSSLFLHDHWVLLTCRPSYRRQAASGQSWPRTQKMQLAHLFNQLLAHQVLHTFNYLHNQNDYK